MSRVYSYDTFRGILILGMIFFHVLANFYSLFFNQDLFYWVPVGFMLFLGIITGRFLVNKNDKINKIASKLIGAFFLFNISFFYHNLFNFPYLDLIKGNQSIFSLEILLPMSLVLFLIGIYNKIWQNNNIKLEYGLVLLLSILILISDFISFYSYNLLFIVYGLLGFFLGKNFDLNKLANYINQSTLKYLNYLLVLVSFIYIFYFPTYRLLSVAQVFSLFVLFSSLNNLKLQTMGQTSFFIYIFHILLIKIMQILFSYQTDSLILITLIFMAISAISYGFTKKGLWARNIIQSRPLVNQ